MFWSTKPIDKGSDNAKLFEKRMKIVKQIAHRNMQKAKYGGHFPVRDDVVVSWEDLLKIWDIADKVLHETPVED